MSFYILDGIPLENYGIKPGRAPLSNVALAGMLNMPKRLGKTFHDWLDDEGVEPYTDADEIFFDGRELTFYGLLKASSQQDAVLKLRDLYEDFGRKTDLIGLTTAWGVFAVYLRQEIDVNYLGNGAASVRMVFEQPNVDFPNQIIPTERTIQQYHIDFIPFSAFGAFIEETDGQYDRPELKQANFTSYNQAGYQLTKIGPANVTLILRFHAPTWVKLKVNVQRFHQVLGAAGTRTVNIDDTEREGFVVDGFDVTQLRILDNKAMCRVRVALVLAFDGKPIINNYLLDEGKEGIRDEQDRFIIIPEAERRELLLESGSKILTETLTPINV